MELLVVVDMQNDFIDGTLGTKKAQELVASVEDKIKNFKGRVYFTRDTHEEDYLNTEEGKHLPVEHCIKGTYGWQIREELQKYIQEAPIDKPGFGSPVLGEICREIDEKTPLSSITLIGLCTDICVISNALICKAYLPNTQIIVDATCCAGVTEESHDRALEAMSMCHIDIMNGKKGEA